MRFRGRVFRFGDNIDTDVIIPATYLSSTDPEELKKHCMEPLLPGFYKKVERGDIIVAGSNFGCGSSREHAPQAIKALGICAVIARSFARIFYRNGMNIGLPLLEADIVDEVQDGMEIEVDLKEGKIKIADRTFDSKPPPRFMLEILSEGGLMNYLRKKRNARV